MDDLISRAAALKICRMYWNPTFNPIMEEIEKLPSARPERKQGKWIEVNDAYNRIRGRCSVCGWESHLYEDDVVGMDYCPNCGARLEAE